jgi:hypothetical protein
MLECTCIYAGYAAANCAISSCNSRQAHAFMPICGDIQMVKRTYFLTIYKQANYFIEKLKDHQQ